MEKVNEMLDFWEDKKVIVTGGAGFLGSFVCEELKKKGCKDIFVPRSSDYDLTKEKDVQKLFVDNPKVDILIHLAAVVGGIGANMEHPGDFYYKNLMMGAMLMEYARLNNVKKFVAVGTICAYPKITPVPFKEENLWNGYPEETNAPYGLAKKMMLVQAQAYRKEYGFNAIFLLPVNLYGPSDNFDPKSSHVIPALIKKIYDAKIRGDDFITIWGDGSPSREFLFVRDAAQGIVMAAERYNGEEPVNLGCGKEITIRDLVVKVMDIMDYKGKIVWDTAKPNGQPRRCLDISKAKEYFGFEAKTEFLQSLKETIEWYIKNVKQK